MMLYVHLQSKQHEHHKINIQAADVYSHARHSYLSEVHGQVFCSVYSVLIKETNVHN